MSSSSNENTQNNQQKPLLNPDFFRDFWEKVKASPLICKSLSFVVVLFSLFGTLNTTQALHLLSLIPASTVELKLWNLFTAPLLELSILNGIFSAIGILMFGVFMHSIWGSRFTIEFIRFMSVVILSSSLFTFVMSVLVYLPTQSFILFTPFYGCGGIIGAFMVCAKQLVPEHTLSLVGFSIRAKYLPSIYFVFATIIGILFDPATIPFVWIGTLSAWIYLRFYQKKIDGTIKGDRSEAFSFSSFFPEAIQPYVAPVSKTVMNAAVKLHLVSQDESLPTTQHYSSSSKGHRLGHGNEQNQNYLPGSNPKEAERRRNLARRALETRMKQNQEEPDVPLTFDSDEEETEENEEHQNEGKEKEDGNKNENNQENNEKESSK